MYHRLCEHGIYEVVGVNGEGKRHQGSYVGKHQSPEAKEDRNYLDQRGQPGSSSHGQWKKSPPYVTPGTVETSPKDVDQWEIGKTARSVPMERKASKAEEELELEQPKEGQPDEEHQEQ